MVSLPLPAFAVVIRKSSRAGGAASPESFIHRSLLRPALAGLRRAEDDRGLFPVSDGETSTNDVFDPNVLVQFFPTQSAALNA